MIYFLQASLIGRIKIGYSTRERLYKRMNQIRTASPVTVELLATCEGNRSKERMLHEKFGASRRNGEWFDPTPDLVRYIAGLQGRQHSVPSEEQEQERKQKRVHHACGWLIRAFRQSRTWPSNDLFKKAKLEGVHHNAVYEAKRMLNIPRAKKITATDGTVAWHWWVPDDWPHLQEQS